MGFEQPSCRALDLAESAVLLSPLMQTPLILASASERRRKLLAILGIPFEVVVPQVQEVVVPDDPRRCASVNAAAKAEWCLSRRPGCAIVAADTVIDFQGRCLTKPASREEAVEFFRLFSGHRHRVITGVGLVRPGAGVDVRIAESEVLFRPLSNQAILDYFKQVDPLDKAGGYDIDNQGEAIIDSYTGSRANIMGLPVEIVAEWLSRGVGKP